jgi:nitroimidazol reductase NimA-like FMN-containing flavoprotein (pyridoxamine 5'-phosphate oxidase superfamily)
MSAPRSSSANGAEMRDGHRALLETLRDFLGSLARGDSGAEDAAALRGAVAFLRQGVLPFARREEHWLGEGSAAAEDAAFEHAFLAAEIDALAQEVEELAAGGAMPRVWRRLHRIEAVLELHVEKAEESGAWQRTTDLDAAPAAPLRAPGVLRKMDPAEAADFLREREWGVLATAAAGRPYGVPVAYGYDGTHLYLATAPGRKAENLEQNPAVSLTVAEVESGSRWRCVIVTGTAERVSGARETLRAIDALRRQQRSAPSLADAARLARARIVRITPDEISGRVRG